MAPLSGISQRGAVRSGTRWCRTTFVFVANSKPPFPIIRASISWPRQFKLSIICEIEKNDVLPFELNKVQFIIFLHFQGDKSNKIISTTSDNNRWVICMSYIYGIDWTLVDLSFNLKGFSYLTNRMTVRDQPIKWFSWNLKRFENLANTSNCAFNRIK